MKPSLIVHKTALAPLDRFRTRRIVISSTPDAACPEKVRDVLRYMPARLFYAAVAEPGAAFNIYPSRPAPRDYYGREYYGAEASVGVYPEFLRIEPRWRPSRWHVTGEEYYVDPRWQVSRRASTQATLVRLAAVLRYARTGYERMEKAARAIHVAQLSSS